MHRRTFTKKSLLATASVAFVPTLSSLVLHKPTVRLGGPLFGTFNDPDSWIAAHQKLGYRAAYCPVQTNAASDLIKAYEAAARKADLVIAEVVPGVTH
jgi:hypothetical protein